jgi:hypothetical protein
MLHPSAETFAPRLTNEVRMFFRAAEGLFVSPLDSLEFEIYLDSFLVHYRLLFSFFQVEPRDNDCVAEHFITTANWRNVRKELFQRSLEEGQRSMGRPRLEKVQQHLAYLNYGQMSRETDWPIADIIADVYEAWGTFLDTLHGDQRQWFPAEELPEIAACKQTICSIGT